MRGEEDRCVWRRNEVELFEGEVNIIYFFLIGINIIYNGIILYIVTMVSLRSVQEVLGR